jgi:hypothetical protein
VSWSISLLVAAILLGVTGLGMVIGSLIHWGGAGADDEEEVPEWRAELE